MTLNAIAAKLKRQSKDDFKGVISRSCRRSRGICAIRLASDPGILTTISDRHGIVIGLVAG